MEVAQFFLFKHEVFFYISRKEYRIEQFNDRKMPEYFVASQINSRTSNAAGEEQVKSFVLYPLLEPNALDWPAYP